MKLNRDLRDYMDVLRSSRWFMSTPARFQELIIGAAVLRSLNPTEQVFARGQPPSGIYCVLEGAVGISGIGKPGKEMLVAHITPSRWFGEMSLFGDSPRVQDAFAETASLVAHVSQDRIETILSAEPIYWRDLGRLISEKLGLAMLTIEEMALAPASVRLPRRLLLIADGYGDGVVPEKVVKVHQDQLAMMLSLSRQTANQILKDLEARGVLKLSYGAIEILDFDRLREAARLGEAH